MIIGRNTVLEREYRLPADICGEREDEVRKRCIM